MNAACHRFPACSGTVVLALISKYAVNVASCRRSHLWCHPLLHAPQLVYPRPKPRRQLAYLRSRQNTRLYPRDARFLIHLVQGTSNQLEASGMYHRHLIISTRSA
jgi:hypothetical protein